MISYHYGPQHVDVYKIAEVAFYRRYYLLHYFYEFIEHCLTGLSIKTVCLLIEIKIIVLLIIKLCYMMITKLQQQKNKNQPIIFIQN